MRTRTGQLTERVTLQRATESADAVGQPTQTWAALPNGSVWAHVEELGGREAMLAGQMKNPLTHRVVIRRYEGLTAADRIIWGTRTLNIAYVTDPVSPRQMFMELGCMEAA